jgi:hypothetical protein
MKSVFSFRSDSTVEWRNQPGMWSLVLKYVTDVLKKMELLYIKCSSHMLTIACVFIVWNFWVMAENYYILGIYTSEITERNQSQNSDV